MGALPQIVSCFSNKNSTAYNVSVNCMYNNINVECNGNETYELNVLCLDQNVRKCYTEFNIIQATCNSDNNFMIDNDFANLNFCVAKSYTSSYMTCECDLCHYNIQSIRRKLGDAQFGIHLASGTFISNYVEINKINKTPVKLHVDNKNKDNFLQIIIITISVTCSTILLLILFNRFYAIKSKPTTKEEEEDINNYFYDIEGDFIEYNNNNFNTNDNKLDHVEISKNSKSIKINEDIFEMDTSKHEMSDELKLAYQYMIMASKNKRDKKFRDAELNYKAAFNIRLKVLGSQHSETITAYLKLQKIKTYNNNNINNNNYSNDNGDKDVSNIQNKNGDDNDNRTQQFSNNNIYYNNILNAKFSNNITKSKSKSNRIERNKLSSGAVRLKDSTAKDVTHTNYTQTYTRHRNKLKNYKGRHTRKARNNYYNYNNNNYNVDDEDEENDDDDDDADDYVIFR